MAQADAGARSMRCPACGGLNPAEADWCGQCHKRFAPPPPPPPPVAVPDHSAAPALEVVSDGNEGVASTPGPPKEAVGVTRGAFTVKEAGIVWTCKACESENSMETATCTSCGTPIAATLRPAEPERPQRDPNMTALISLFFPGAGHAYLGLWPQAIARAVLQSWVVGAAVVGAFSRSMFLIFFFGLASLALWAIAAHDALREAAHQPSLVILKGRAFLWIVLGLLAVLFIAVTIAALGAPGLTA